MPLCLIISAMSMRPCARPTKLAKRGAKLSPSNPIRISRKNLARILPPIGRARMTHRFKKHYTREEARALLPSIRKWLKQLADLRAWLRECDGEMEKSLREGCDLGGERVNTWIKRLCQLQRVAREFESREIQIKDVDRGL